jgi:predicted ATPase/DNA-binding winged helix-turn-helix (wHTH) protein
MNQPLVFGPFSLNAKEASLRRGAENILLPPKAFAVLCYLVEKPGLLVTKNELIEAVWPRGYVDEAVLKACINEIRKALGDDPKSPRYIETVFKHGYRFIAQIEPNQLAIASPKDYSNQDITALFDWSPVSQQEDTFRVGRQNILNHLDEALAPVLNHQRKIIFLTGEAGIGKSTVIDMFLDRVADKDIGLLHGQCIDHYGSGEAYLPLLDALARPCRLPNAKPLVDKIKDIAPTWMEQMPWLLSTDEKREIRRETLGATKERMLREFCELIENLSLLRPLILILEDLHWSDFSTIDFLTLFAKRREPAAVIILGTFRPLEVKLKEHPIAKSQNDLQIHHLCTCFSMDSLAIGDIEEYLDRRFQNPAFRKMLAASVFRRSEGNPLFMVNLVDNLANQGGIVKIESDWVLSARFSQIEASLPDNLRGMINLQIDRLNPQEQWLLRVASVEGVEISVPVVANVLGQNSFQVDVICSELARRGDILTTAEAEEWTDGSLVAKYAFRHALYSEVLYEQLSFSQRVNLHGAVGLAIENIYENHIDKIAPEAARHFEEARDYKKAIQLLSKSALDAAHYNANEEAINYLERAVVLTDRLKESERAYIEIDLLLQRVHLRKSIFDMVGAKTDLELVINLAKINNLPEFEIKALMELTVITYWTERRLALEKINSAVILAKNIGNEQLQIQAESALGYWNTQLIGWSEIDAKRCQLGLDYSRQCGNNRLIGIRLCYLSAVNSYNGKYQVAAKQAEEAIRILLDVYDERHYYMVSYHFFAWSNLHLGKFDQTLEITNDYEVTAKKNSNQAGLSAAMILEAWIYNECCQFDEAKMRLENAFRSSKGSQTSYYLGRLGMGRSLLGLGDYENAYAYFKEILDLILIKKALMESAYHYFLYRGLTEYWFAQGNFEEAKRSAMTLCQLAENADEKTYLSIGYAWLAEIDFRTDSVSQCQSNMLKAIETLGNDYLSYPLAAWRVFGKAAELFEKLGINQDAKDKAIKSAEVISHLADSLGNNHQLKTAFLSSPQVRKALGKSEPKSTYVSIL